MTEFALMLIVWCLALHDCVANGAIKVMTLMSSWSLRTVSPGHLRMAWREGEEEGRRRKMVKVMMTVLI